MSLLGIDVGTTGCKAFVFHENGQVASSAYREYDVQTPQPGWAELDSEGIWRGVKDTIREAVSLVSGDEIRALAISSLGEAMVPVSSDRKVLGPSLLNFDVRGEQYLERLGAGFAPEQLYGITGNALGNHYALPKLMWLKEHQPKLYDNADKFLLWGAFIAYMLGAEAVVDFSLANRTLLFDIVSEAWSDEILGLAGIDSHKLPDTKPSGVEIGTVSNKIAQELGLPSGVRVVTGAHDQCANAVGCGVVKAGTAMYGMGTYICAVPVFDGRRDTRMMLSHGLNTEHHAVPGKLVSFVYNEGGVLFKWYRDTFAAEDRRLAEKAGGNVYAKLISEMPPGPSGVFVLPYFTATGPPEFVSDACGLVAGLKLETKRGEILKGMLEGATYYLRECLERLPAIGIDIGSFRAVGGGSNSDEWVQLSADILNRPFVRPRITEAGSLGAALMAGKGCGLFASLEEGAEAMVTLEREFSPQSSRHAEYTRNFERYKKMWPLFGGYLREISSA